MCRRGRCKGDDLPGPRPAEEAPLRDEPLEPLGLYVLLAEDNWVNRKVALRMLERWRCRVHAVTNGREAVDALEHSTFDAVLMDVEMPEMDGLEATAEIRRRERGGRRRVPIIAMTAHSMESDRERCLDAGMDDYASKPIRPRDLHAALQRGLSRSEPQPLQVLGEAAEAQVFRYEQLQSYSEGDGAFEAELIGEFLANAAKFVAALESSSPKTTTKNRVQIAHTLRGMALNLGADALGRAAGELQRRLGSPDPARARAALAGVRTELERVEAVLRGWQEREAA